MTVHLCETCFPSAGHEVCSSRIAICCDCCGLANGVAGLLVYSYLSDPRMKTQTEERPVVMMTPLKIEIMLHYNRGAGDYRGER
jgi:hypothetical protein